MRFSMRASLLSALALGLAQGVAPASDLLTLHQVGSFAKSDASSVFDAARRHLVVIGGLNSVPEPYVHVLDLSGAVATWRSPNVLGTAPPVNLTNAPAVYDSLRDRMIVLEGTSMWSLSLAVPMTWTHTTPGGTPPTLGGAAAIYDPVRDRIVGFGSNGPVSQTWQLSLGASPAWAAVPFIGAVPPWRTDGAFAYDAAADRMIVTLGQTAAGDVNNTWQLTLAGTPGWSLLPTTGTPHPLTHDAAFAFDPAARVLRVFSGTSSSSTSRLDVATGAWTAISTSEFPPSRSAAASAWDAAGSRMILTGGLAAPKGDLWQLTSDWSEIPATGGAMRVADFAGYDAAQHRYAATVLGAPAFLSMVDSTWTVAGPQARPFRTMARFYDPGLNLLGTFDADTLYSIHPGVDVAWTRSATIGVKPPFFNAGTIYQDHPNHRVLVFGGETFGPGAPVLSTALFVFDYLTASWTAPLGSTPIGRRHTATMHDTQRNRLVFFGGGEYQHLGPPSALNDLWSMDLSTLAFVALTPGGTPPSQRYFFPAAYDPLRDRGLVFGGIQFGVWLKGIYYLQFAPGDANGTWSRNDPVGDPVPDIPGYVGDLDPGLDRFFVPGAASYWELGWGPTTEPIVAQCPASTVWTKGASLPLTFRLTQNSSTPVNYAWTVTSQRNWPGFPITGFQQLTDFTSVDLVVAVPVPDTASAGVDTLTFKITDGSASDSCKVAIGDQAPPMLWALVEARMAGDRVRLEWRTPDRTHTSADIERRVEQGSWETLGAATITGDGAVRFEDTSIAPGTRYAYRAGIAGAWSDEAWVEIPAVRLAFARQGLIIRGALEISFTLPVDGTARLEVFDLAGRRVRVRELAGFAAGAHSVTLADAGALRGGVYFLRLMQGREKANARAFVVGDR